jgi:hypothetical protein
LTTNFAPVGTELFDDLAIPVIPVIHLSHEILLLSLSFLLKASVIRKEKFPDF